MTSELGLLYLTAIAIGVGHTVVGPDHYVPFAAMAQAGRWTMRKTLVVTTLCGLGHVASSVVLGVVGIGLGLAVERMDATESARANIAGWLLLGFGLIYMVVGFIRAMRNVSHEHWHTHSDGILHVHPHTHNAEHLHVHSPATNAGPPAKTSVIAPWALFLVFLYGPCEPLIPMLMYPAANAHWMAVVVVTLLFAAATITTMVALVAGLCLGARTVGLQRLDRFNHALAGMAIVACGLAIKCGF